MRARAFAVALAAVLLVVAGGGARAQAPVHLRLGVLPVDVGAQGYYAADEGFFKQAGLDVELVTLPNGPATAAAVASGSIDVGSSNALSLAVAHERGLPFVAIAPAGGYTTKNSTADFVVAKTSPIKSASDFNGKTIAVATVGSIGHISVKAWLDQHGADVTTVHFIEMPFSAMDPALAAGRVDGAVLDEPSLDKTVANHGRLFANVYDAIAPEFLEGAYFSTTTFVAAHGVELKKFRDVMAQTARWANANHAVTAKILEKYSGVSVADLTHRVTYPDHLDPARLQPLIDTAAKYGALKASFPARELIAPGF